GGGGAGGRKGGSPWGGGGGGAGGAARRAAACRGPAGAGARPWRNDRVRVGDEDLRAGRDGAPRRLLRDREGRVRVRRRRLGLGQVDDRAPAPEGARADPRPNRRRRPRPDPAAPLQGSAAPPQRRLRLPGLQAAADPYGGRERRVRTEGAGRELDGDPP